MESNDDLLRITTAPAPCRICPPGTTARPGSSDGRILAGTHPFGPTACPVLLLAAPGHRSGSWCEMNGSEMEDEQVDDRGRSSLLQIIGGLLFLGAFGFVGYQFARYLWLGEWPGFSVFDSIVWLFGTTAPVRWLQQPDSWIELQKIVTALLRAFPFSLFLGLLGWLLLRLGSEPSK